MINTSFFSSLQQMLGSAFVFATTGVIFITIVFVRSMYVPKSDFDRLVSDHNILIQKIDEKYVSKEKLYDVVRPLSDTLAEIKALLTDHFKGGVR